MNRIVRWEVGVCLLLLLGLLGCSETKPDKVMEINEMTNLDGKPHDMYPPLSPVLQDTYDKAILEDVYSVD